MYVPLSDPIIVRGLLQNRAKVDDLFVNEDVICTYLDLDDLILVCGLSASEEQVVKYVMRGYAVADIADYYGGARQTYNKFYSRAVEKICAAAIAQSIKGLMQIAKENGG